MIFMTSRIDIALYVNWRGRRSRTNPLKFLSTISIFLLLLQVSVIPGNLALALALAQEHDTSSDDCEIWVAASTLENAGLGAFNGGRSISKGDYSALDQDQIAVPMVDVEFHNDFFRDSPEHQRSNWRNYLMNFFISTSDFSLSDHFPPDTHMLISGTGSLVNCHFALNNVREPAELEIDTLDMHRSTHPGVGAFSAYHGYHTPTIGSIQPYAEVFGSYGKDWFRERKKTIGVVPFDADWKNAQEFLDKYQHLFQRYEDIFTDAMWEDLWNMVSADHSEELHSNLETFIQTHSPTASIVDVLATIIKLILDLTARQVKALPTKWEDAQHVMEVGSLQQFEVEKSTRSLDWLQAHGRCMDGIQPGKSLIFQAGRGAFAKKVFQAGDIVAHAPLLHVADRAILNIYSVKLVPDDETGDLEETRDLEVIRGTQLLVNYCFGRDPSESTLLLCPYGSNTLHINHHPTDHNVQVVWATNTTWFDPKCLDMTTAELGLHARTCLAIDYIATREIAPGEEILIDYGQQWEEAWQDHLKTWEPHPHWASTSPLYVRAHDLNKNKTSPLRTLDEEEKNPYSGNIHIQCWHTIRKKWFSCDVMSRIKRNEGDYEYVVEIDIRFPATEENDDDEEEGDVGIEQSEESGYFERYNNFPRRWIRFLDEWYSGDEFLPNAFRHEMGLPDHLFSEHWKNSLNDVETVLQGNEEASINCQSNQSCAWDDDLYDFISSPHLEPGQIEPIRWRDTGVAVNRYSARVGLDPKLPQELLAFAERLGIVDRFWNLLQYKGPLDPGGFEMIRFDHDENLQFYINRPDKEWESNMHWANAANEYTHEEYVKVLARGNFDATLKAIGDFFDLDGLFIQGVSFIGVSQCEKSYIHNDMTQTGGKFFNVLFPLILVEGARPELILQDDDSQLEGVAKYIPNEAMIVGDDAYHGTAACDYTNGNTGIRVSASIYIADVNMENIEEIVSDTTTIFPVPFDRDWVLASKGRHWGGTASLATDKGRQTLVPVDKWANCAELALKGACEKDIWEMRANCVMTCKVFVDETYYSQIQQ